MTHQLTGTVPSWSFTVLLCPAPGVRCRSEDVHVAINTYSYEDYERQMKFILLENQPGNRGAEEDIQEVDLAPFKSVRRDRYHAGLYTSYTFSIRSS